MPPIAPRDKSEDQKIKKSKPKNVALFVTCLVDLFRPSVGFASVKLLQEAGCQVSVPEVQTCCGQPAYNSGDKATTRSIAMQVIEAFEPYEAIVAPSGSCAAMLKKHYVALFEDASPWHTRAKDLADKTYELTSFLVEVLGQNDIEAQCEATATYHDSCSGLRELGIREQPRKLLRSVQGLRMVEMKDRDNCCGFGGTFCVKYPEISNAMVSKKTDDIADSGADIVLAGDMGCLMNMAGKLKRQGHIIHVRHVAEILAGMTDTPAIGQALPKAKKA